MSAELDLSTLRSDEKEDGSIDVTPKSAPGNFKIESDSIINGRIGPRFIFDRHDPNGENKHPHLKVSGLGKDKSTCGVVVIHDPVDSDDWCHGVLVFQKDQDIEEGINQKRIGFMGVIEGINDLNRNTRGDAHNTEQEIDPRARGYIGPYPGYDGKKNQAEQGTHEYNFDGYEVAMTLKELFFAVAQITRRKLGEVLDGEIDDFTVAQLKDLAVLTKENVLEAISGKVINKSNFIGTYKNPGWLNQEWVGPDWERQHRD